MHERYERSTLGEQRVVQEHGDDWSRQSQLSVARTVKDPLPTWCCFVRRFGPIVRESFVGHVDGQTNHSSLGTTSCEYDPVITFGCQACTPDEQHALQAHGDDWSCRSQLSGPRTCSLPGAALYAVAGRSCINHLCVMWVVRPIVFSRHERRASTIWS